MSRSTTTPFSEGAASYLQRVESINLTYNAMLSQSVDLRSAYSACNSAIDDLDIGIYVTPGLTAVLCMEKLAHTSNSFCKLLKKFDRVWVLDTLDLPNMRGGLRGSCNEFVTEYAFSMAFALEKNALKASRLLTIFRGGGQNLNKQAFASLITEQCPIF